MENRGLNRLSAGNGRGQQETWEPATRLAAGVAGSTLLVWGARLGFPVGCAIGTVGLVLLARSLTNVSFGRLLGLAGSQPEQAARTSRPGGRHGGEWKPALRSPAVT